MNRPLDIEGRFSAPPDCSITFDGRRYAARKGEPLAVTLLAHGVYVLGRSAKYHRPRGLWCGRGACGNCLARVDASPSRELCLTPAREGCEARSQNVLGTARHDLLATVDWVFAAGLDHHHMMTHSTLLNRAFVGMARGLNGLGELPDIKPWAAAPPVERRVDVAIVGAGLSGRAAAQAVTAAGFTALVLERSSTIAVSAASEVVQGAAVLGLYDDDALVAIVGGERQWHVRARRTILATGTYEQPPACPGNDLPGVLSLTAAELALHHGVLPGRRVALVMAVELDLATRSRAQELGARLAAAGALAVSVGAATAEALVSIEGHGHVRAVRTSAGERFGCDAVVVAGRSAPAYELPRQMGLATPFDPTKGGFAPTCGPTGQTARADVFVAGELTGVTRDQAAAHGAHVGAQVAASLRDEACR